MKDTAKGSHVATIPMRRERSAMPTPTIVGEALASPARALDERTRTSMEQRFGGADFRSVRVHTDATSAASARAINAHAYTLGNDVVFGSGRYAPETEQGRALIAHELGHVVQQAFGAPHAIMRQAGTDPQASWDALVNFDVTPDTPENQQRAKDAIQRVIKTKEGALLVNQLWNTFATGKKHRLTSSIAVHFVDTLPKGVTDATGFFSPSLAGASQYDVSVRNEQPPPAGVISLGGTWPGKPATQSYYYAHTDAESVMGATLFHELLHVWFVNTQTGAVYPTGHQDVLKDQIDPLFFSRLKTFSGELDDLEKKMHEPATTPAAPTKTPPDLDEPSTKRPSEPTGPRFVGGQVTVGGAAGSKSGGILGADLLLGKIHSLDIGARGVYLTPKHLLVGGTVGMRMRQGADDRGGLVDNPLFFDVEAGVLRELGPTDATRLTNSIAGFGSIGIGQELGRRGARFVWRVGGFVIVSDKSNAQGKPIVEGGATGSVGVVF